MSTLGKSGRGSPNSRVTEGHLGQSNYIRAFMSSSKRPYGLAIRRRWTRNVAKPCFSSKSADSQGLSDFRRIDPVRLETRRFRDDGREP